MFKRDELFIGGRWETSTGSGRLQVISPTTEDVVGDLPAPTSEDVDRAVGTARAAFDTGPWPRMAVADRADALQRVVDHLMARSDDAVELQIDEMGGTRSFIEANFRGIPPLLDQIVRDSQQVALSEVRDGTSGQVLVTRHPVGVVAGIVPWNSPLMVAMTKLVPALLTGCPIVLKTAPESPLSAYVLAEAVEAAGLPPGVVSVLGGAVDVGEALVAHPGVDMVTFTGSTLGGRKVASVCGAQLKRVTCELGGKSAAIFLPEADLGRFVPIYLGNCVRNVGQICIALSRVLVPRPRQDELVDGLAAMLSAMSIGDPHDPNTDLGPLAAERQRERVEGCIRSGIEEGAALAYGGGRPAGLGRGWFVEPTVFRDVSNTMTVAREEVFGPVISVIPYDHVDEAVATANDSEYGLFGAVYGPDVKEATRVACRLQTGTCAINEGPSSGGGGPFGGWKQSGLGRERAPEGLLEFLELRSIAMPPDVPVPLTST
jgi:betaine-aldehyde dehydrogenase